MNKNFEIRLTKSISWDASEAINALIAGSRGMGKSYMTMALMLRLANLSPPAQIFGIDFKQSDISRLNKLLPDGRIAAEKDEIFNLLNRFIELMKKRRDFINSKSKFGATANGLKMPLFYLIYDEYGAFTSVLSNKEKKEHDALLSQIMLLGRQYNFGIILISQQVSVGNSGLNSNLKEQCGLIIHMGTATKEALRITFGNEIALYNNYLGVGEGQLWMQGVTNGFTLPFVAEDLSNVDLWLAFKDVFADSQNDERYLYMMD
ncbi:FtsK/SpoIIIE domain-containing protein [Ligilactobacillus aviarius]|uniref:FtsK/SpoIIIE domain-containing protein n=1 Tax=Ligilactobacillus aviarius TaxID=1606 RepID=UPI0024BB5BB2|nr:FtsK/SpoIIIE domain-containing protein [Ligilactobacillus aviarius]